MGGVREESQRREEKKKEDQRRQKVRRMQIKEEKGKQNTLPEVMLIVIFLIRSWYWKETTFLGQKTASPSQIAFLHLHCLFMN